MAAKTGATKLLLDMEVGGWKIINFPSHKERQSYLQLASRLKKQGKGKWKMMKQPCGDKFAIWREA